MNIENIKIDTVVKARNKIVYIVSNIKFNQFYAVDIYSKKDTYSTFEISKIFQNDKRLLTVNIKSKDIKFDTIINDVENKELVQMELF